jgi:hypothetical protein
VIGQWQGRRVEALDDGERPTIFLSCVQVLQRLFPSLSYLIMGPSTPFLLVFFFFFWPL